MYPALPWNIGAAFQSPEFGEALARLTNKNPDEISDLFQSPEFGEALARGNEKEEDARGDGFNPLSSGKPSRGPPVEVPSFQRFGQAIPPISTAVGTRNRE